MAEETEPTALSNKPDPILCAECNVNPSKYKCPGCSLRSCSLPCVNSHKQRTACTGKRPVTSFVPISQFDDSLLLSDYNMLEDVKRIADSAKRRRVDLCGNYRVGLPFPLKCLRKAASSRKTSLLFLSSGMAKRGKNRTYYDIKKKSISWTIEWRFHSTDTVLLDHGIEENSFLSSVIAKHLKPGPWNHSLRQFCDQSLDSLKFFIRKKPKGPKSPYVQLNINAPIRQQLANISVLEYPVIHVYLPSHSYDFVVINNTNPRKVETKEPAHQDYPSPKGVTFREEEIEDGGSLDPLILDLLSNAPEKRLTENEQKQMVQGPPVFKGENCARPVSHIDNTEHNTTTTRIKSCIEELAEIGDLDFEFQAGPINVYPDLIKDGNPDDLLDFDGIGIEFLRDEELEEGEIA